MKINCYCKKCKKAITHYNKAKYCWSCWKIIRRIGAKWLIKYCKDCGKELKNRKAEYCKSCAGKLRQKHYHCIDCGRDLNRSYKAKRCRKCYKQYCNVPSTNPSYIDGRSKIEYGVGFTEELKEQVRKRDGYKCVICNFSQRNNIKKYKKRLEIHHKDCNKNNHNINNLISLCTVCHLKLHNQIEFKNKHRGYIYEK